MGETSPKPALFLRGSSGNVQRVISILSHVNASIQEASGWGPFFAGQREDGTGDTRVYVVGLRGEVSPLDHEVKHSPTGFEWGYNGSGPADLARCILRELYGADPMVDRLYQQFKSAYVARFGPCWVISVLAVRAWVRANVTPEIVSAVEAGERGSSD